MSRDEREPEPPRVEGGPDATLLRDGSTTNEAHPEINPQSPRELISKVKKEAGEGHGVLDKARRVLEEFDRDIGGEYERREDPTGRKPHPDSPPARPPEGTDGLLSARGTALLPPDQHGAG